MTKITRCLWIFALCFALAGFSRVAASDNPFADGVELNVRADVERIQGSDAVVSVGAIIRDEGGNRYGSTSGGPGYRILLIGLTGYAIGDLVQFTIKPTGEIREGLRCFVIVPTIGVVRGFEPSKMPIPQKKSVPSVSNGAASGSGWIDQAATDEAYELASRYIKPCAENAYANIISARKSNTIPETFKKFFKSTNGRIQLADWFQKDLEKIQTRTKDPALKQLIIDLLQTNKE